MAVKKRKLGQGKRKMEAERGLGLLCHPVFVGGTGESGVRLKTWGQGSS